MKSETCNNTIPEVDSPEQHIEKQTGFNQLQSSIVAMTSQRLTNKKSILMSNDEKVPIKQLIFFFFFVLHESCLNFRYFTEIIKQTFVHL